MGKVLKHPSLVTGVIIISILSLVALLSLFYDPADYNKVNPTERNVAPSMEHPFGTDRFGRDILTRCLVGSQNALLVGLLATSVGLIVGVLLGSLSGFYGGAIDEIVMRVMDGLYAFPPLIFALMIVAVLGSGISKTILAIGVVNIPVFARVTRAGFLAEREKEYVEAARAVGASDSRIVFLHVLPNVVPALLVQLSVSFATAILAEASLSFLGLGTQPPDPSWGRMLRDARVYLSSAPWAAISPGLCILLSVMGFNMLGDGLRDILDPKLRS